MKRTSLSLRTVGWLLLAAPFYLALTSQAGTFKRITIEIINDNPKYYVFSNVFEVANASKPYEKVAVAKNLEYVIEAIRAEGDSGWMAASHDEFCIVMDGEVTVELLELDNPDSVVPPTKDGTVAVEGEDWVAHTAAQLPTVMAVCEAASG